MKAADHTITREAEHPGYDSPEDDFYLLVDGKRIGGTYWCPADPSTEAGQQYVSYGPAGYSFGHHTREHAEQAQLQAAGITTNTPTQTIPRETPTQDNTGPLPMTWDQALTEATERGVHKCSAPALMASVLDASLPFTVGAVSPRLVWEGAQKSGLTTKQVLRMAVDDVMAVEALQWL